MSHLSETLATLIASKNATVGVIGLGYVGLPLGMTFANAGFRVLGFDLDSAKVANVNRGHSYIKHIDSHALADLQRSGKLAATTEFSRIGEMDCVVICVPTPLTAYREPDMSFIIASAEAIAPHVRHGQLFCLESTTYPGTTDEVLRPILERGGLKAGEDFFLAFSPEREDPGNANFNTRNITKVVGGHSAECLSLASAFYGAAISSVVPVSSTQVAEMTKLLENIFRSVNIALVNELKLLCDRMSLDIWEVIAAASTKPFGFMPFYPGPGLGGHCIPIDPFYLTWRARQFDFQTKFIELAGEVNAQMPSYVVSRTMEALNQRRKSVNGAKVLVLGAAYKRDVDDTRESPSLRIISMLKDRGAVVHYHDPFVPELAAGHGFAHTMKSVPLSPASLGDYDAVLILTNHSTVDYGEVVANAQLVVDTRNATGKSAAKRENVVRA
jgi:UDP-N-acetyl-D-glucosamine dehydrogenase